MHLPMKIWLLVLREDGNRVLDMVLVIVDAMTRRAHEKSIGTRKSLLRAPQTCSYLANVDDSASSDVASLPCLPAHHH